MNSAKSSGAGLDAPSNLPDELQLQLAPGQAIQFAVPPMAGCEIQWEIAQLGKFSQSLADGTAQIITLAVPPTARPHSLIRGQILIVRSADGALVRSVPVAGWVRNARLDPEPQRRDWRFPWAWLGWLLATFVVIAVAVGAVRLTFRPALVVQPASIDFGTLWYSPPIGGRVETSLVFTARWRAVPQHAEDLVLVAHTEYQFSGEKTGQGSTEETMSFPLSKEINESVIPLGSGKRNEDTVRISGTISLTVSNAVTLTNLPLRVFPDHIPFSVQFKPAASQ